MSKYDPLGAHLSAQKGDSVVTSFAEIERILGFKLPRSARTHSAWWANQSGEALAQRASWQQAGWQTKDLDLLRSRVTFRRAGPGGAKDAVPKPARPAPAAIVREQAAPGGMTIAQARAGLARQFGVMPDRIEILIRG